MLLARSGEERLKMGCSMHATARVLVIASIPQKDTTTVNRCCISAFTGMSLCPKSARKF
jgi:hypothetical protein